MKQVSKVVRSTRISPPREPPKVVSEINQAIQAEMDAIQQSLTRLTKVIHKSKTTQKTKISVEASNKITKSLGLWNTMI